jgi:hypothetical protein
MWFLERWCRTYLFLRESDYSVISPNFVRSFSASGGGQEIFNFVTGVAYKNFVLWDDDECVLENIIALFDMFATRTLDRDRLIMSGTTILIRS